MAKLSVVIITLNEEKNIRRCLESVRAIADEIVIVDSCSTDKTQEIVSTFNVTFITQPFLGYIEQKNFALSKTSNDFVLSLDADEALDEKLQLMIKQEMLQPKADAYEMSRMTHYCGKWIRHGAWYPDRKIRMFNKSKAKWGGINPHDKIELSINAKQHSLEGDILHYTYYSLTEHIQQADNFTRILAEDLFKRGKRTNIIRIITKPKFRFIRDYIFKGGFRDGYYGFVIAIISAYAVFLKEIRLKEHWDNNG